jgi:hypothetical protein
MCGGAPPDRVLMRPGQHRDALAQFAVCRHAAVQVGVDPQDVGQSHRIGVIGLRPRHRVTLPVAGHRQRVDRIHRPPRRPQRRNQQAPRGLDRHRDRVLRAITGSSEHFDEIGEPVEVVGDALLGDNCPALSMMATS